MWRNWTIQYSAGGLHPQKNLCMNTTGAVFVIVHPGNNPMPFNQSGYTYGGTSIPWNTTEQ